MDPATLDLDRRSGLPDDWLFLLQKHPRPTWPENPGLGDTGRIWLANHGWFRAAVSEAGRAIGLLREGKVTPAPFAPWFDRHTGGLLGGLDAHHNVEDAHYFPLFRQAEPRLLRGFDLMEADHHDVHAAIEAYAKAARDLLDALPRGGEALPDAARFAADAFATTLARFGRSLSRHLDDEEDLVIPLVLERAFRDPEFGAD